LRLISSGASFAPTGSERAVLRPLSD